MIDVIMLTKNSNKPFFKRVLAAIKRNILVHHFIVVDSYSTDGTVDVIREFFKDKVVVIKTRASLGFARYIGMKLVDTEWFAFIDSDVEILEGWHENAKPLMRVDRIWGIQGVFINSRYANIRTYGKIEVVKNIDEVPRKFIVKYGFYRFSGADTGHVLLRRNVVSLLSPYIMKSLRSGEDFYIAQEITRAGYYYIRTDRLKAIHHRAGKINISKLVERAFNAHGLALYIDLKTFTLYNLCRMLKVLRERNVELLLWHLFYLLGELKAKSEIWTNTRTLRKVLASTQCNKYRP